jgi:hypothetical protein
MSASGDLADALEGIVREDAVALLGTTGRDLRAAPLRQVLLAAGNYRARMVDPVPRTVHRSLELDAALTDDAFRLAVGAIEDELRCGLDMSSRLSDRFRRSHPKDETAKARRQFVDHLLSTWRVHHLHLGPRRGSGRVRQGDDLLFVRITRTDAYLIALLPHGPSAFGASQIVETIYRNWPEEGLVTASTYAIGLTQRHTEEERFRIQEAGAVSFVEVDGRVIAPPGGAGQVIDGGSAQVTLYVNAFTWDLDELRRSLDNDPLYLDTFVSADRRHVSIPSSWTPTLYEDRYGFASPTGLFVPVTRPSPLLVTY